MGKVKEAMEYYDIYLDKKTPEEAKRLFKEAGYVVNFYDPIYNLLGITALEDPKKRFKDINEVVGKWSNGDIRYSYLVW